MSAAWLTTLNRPELYNAYNGKLIAALLVAFDQLGRESVRAAVISGNGRNFQAGADINWLDTVRRSSPQNGAITGSAPVRSITSSARPKPPPA